jgi:hypothetical protein
MPLEPPDPFGRAALQVLARRVEIYRNPGRWELIRGSPNT